MNDNRELAEKLLDAKDMEYEMTRQEEQDEMDNILNEVNSEFQGHLEQLQSDLEDAKVKIALLEGTLENWKSIANKDRERANDYKRQMQKAEQKNAIGWFKY